LLSRLGDIKNVIDHLEGEADVVAEIGQGAELVGEELALMAPSRMETSEQGGGFAFMDIAQLIGGDTFAFTFQISHLAGDELERACRPGKFQDDVPMGVAGPAATLGCDLKSLGQKGISGEDGDAFPKTLWLVGLPRRKSSLSHGWKIVMDK